MSQPLYESLSATIDGEAQKAELRRVLEETCSDAKLQKEWNSYSAISSVLRGEKLSSLKKPLDWEKLAASVPDDHNIVAMQGKRRFNSKLIGGSSAILAIAATLLIGVFVFRPFDDRSVDPALVELAEQSETSSGPVSTTTLVNIPNEVQQRHYQYMLEHDKNVTVSNSTPFALPRVVSRSTTSSAEQ